MLQKLITAMSVVVIQTPTKDVDVREQMLEAIEILKRRSLDLVEGTERDAAGTN